MAEATGPGGWGRSSSWVRLFLMLVLGSAVAFPYAATNSAPSPSVLTGAPGGEALPSAGKTPGKDPAKKGDLDKEDEPKKDALSLLGEFAGITVAPPASDVDDPLRMTSVRDALRHNAVGVEFVIVTVPDPIDSNARWLFDPMMAAVGSAAAASGYLLDRFYIPDWDPREAGSDHTSAPRTAHERWPAVVLFRHDGFSTTQRRLLLVSLVPETPTSGIHQQAFKSAVSRIILWYDRHPPEPIRILGPNFSGSIPSLSMAIDSFRDASPKLRFRVVSGGATAPQNRESIQPLPNGPATTFHATVLPDDFVSERTLEFLIDTDESLKERGRVAFLVEENTSYGRGLGQTSLNKQPSEAPAMCDGTSAYCAKVVFDHARRLPFPLHISRLRSAAAAAAPRQSALPAPPHLALPLDEPGSVTDQIPSLSAKSTSASVELVIANILDTIDREHITTVGLLATDARDKLFLAEQIARRDTTVRLFTIESDLFYLHQDYSAYTRGMIVASTYPLFNQNQHWVNREVFQRQFPTTNAQGAYNAMLALLNYTEGGDSVPSTAPPPELLDYVTPGVSARWPALWISVVGQDAIWPLRWYDAPDSAISYLQKISSPATVPVIVAHASAWTDFIFLGLLTLVAVHLIAYQWRGPLSRYPSLSRSVAKYILVGDFHRRKPYALLMFGTLLIGYGYACSVFGLFVVNVHWSDYTRFRAGCIAITIGVSLAVLLWLTICWIGLAVACIRGAYARFVAMGPGGLMRRPQEWMPVAAAVVLASLAFTYGFAYLASFAGVPARRMYYFERITHMQNGVSPAPAIAFLLGAVYLWTFAHLRRLIGISGAELEARFLTFRELAPMELPQAVGDLRQFIDGTVRALPTPYVCGIAAVCLVFGYVTFVHPLATPEVREFTVAFRAAWLLVQLLILLAFAQIFYFWRVLRRSFKPFTRTPMIAAFDRLPPNLFGDRLSPQRPQIGDLRRAIRVGEQLRLAISEAGGSRPLGMDDAERYRLQDALQWPDPAAKAPQTRWWAHSSEWRWLGRACEHLAPVVARSWTVKRQNALKTVDFDCQIGTVTKPAQLWFLRAEEFLALQILFLVRELLGRLVNVCFFTITGVLLMVGAQHSFPFEPRQELLGTAWLYVISAVAVVLRIFVQMERDPVLSAFASNQAGKLRWDTALWSKVLVYGAIPIATIFAAQFPEIGSTILGWLAPVQGVLR